MKLTHLAGGLAALGGLSLVLTTAAEKVLSKADLKAAGKLAEGTLYLRLNLPCRYVYYSSTSSFHPETLAKVSLDGSDLDLGQPTLPASLTSKGAVWWFEPNDAVRYAKVYESRGTVEISVEGVPPKDEEIIVAFDGIKTLDDFKKVFDRTFSRLPLQDEHPEWPSEIRQAIAARRLIEGMSREQAYAVVGRPLEINGSRQEGKEVEAWTLRQEIGFGLKDTELKRLLRQIKSNRTGFPERLKFVEGKLAEIVQTPAPSPLVK